MSHNFVIVVDDESAYKRRVQVRMFASVKNAKTKIRAEHRSHEERRAYWLTEKTYRGEPYDIGEWPQPRIFEVSYTPEGGLQVTSEVE